MKKSFLIIGLTLCCRLVLSAQEFEISVTAQKYIDRAEMAMKNVQTSKDWQKVIDELEKALVEIPNHPSIIYNLGICYHGMGGVEVNNYKKAIEYYRKFLTLNPNEEDKKDVDNRINEAEKSIKSAIPQKYLERAKMAMDRIEEPSDYQKVIDELKQAFFEAPNDLSIAQSVIYNLGICYNGMGVLDFNNYEIAIKFYRLYLELNPNEKDSISATNRMSEAEQSIGVKAGWGVIWATCNVGSPGRFTSNPEDYGGLYTYVEAKNVCPEGWRLPTRREYYDLIDRNGSDYGKEGEIKGLFFPFAGLSQGRKYGRSLYTVTGNYWCSRSSLYDNYRQIFGYSYRQIFGYSPRFGASCFPGMHLMWLKSKNILMFYELPNSGARNSLEIYNHTRDMKKISHGTRYSVRCVRE